MVIMKGFVGLLKRNIVYCLESKDSQITHINFMIASDHRNVCTVPLYIIYFINQT